MDFPTEIRAAVLRATDQPIALETIRLKAVAADEVRVRIDATGVCHSDLSLARGLLAQPLPAVLGHEATGTVLETGSEVDRVSPGDRVVLLWISPCGDCFFCQNGEPHLCVHGNDRAAEPYAIDSAGQPVHPGLGVASFAEQTVVRQNAVVRVPDDVDDTSAALLGCAVTTGVGAARKVARVHSGASVLVLGLGGVGLSTVMGARLAGAARIIAVDRNPDRGGLAEQLGATEFVLADDGLRREVRRLTGPGADYVFDCVGSARTIRDGWGLARRGGTLCVVGIGGQADKVEFSALELFHFARTLVGCVGGSLDAAADLPGYFELIRSGTLDLAPLATGTAGIADIEDCFAELAAGRAVRTLLRPGAA
ncbi:MAG TPA: zinc-binding dehydrogenase [Jatrophihabitans sp.]|nr:zinc-binding dehydrogenase [Jatrophihabitans sp.]